MPDLEQACLAILNGKQADISELALKRLLCFAQEHGVVPLLRHHLQSAPDSITVSKQFMEKLHTQTILETAVELARQRELKHVLSALTNGGIKPLLMKGTPLAYLIYSNPTLRPRCDTDLLIPVADKQNTINILNELGYQLPNVVSGNFVRHQITCIKKEKSGLMHQLDLHWKISNQPSFAHTMVYDNLIKNAISVPDLGPHARTLALTDALLFACLHRTWHAIDGDSNRLIWLYDIHLLCKALTPDELQSFTTQATSLHITSICLDALEQTQLRFHTNLPSAVLTQLREPSIQSEPSTSYLQGSRFTQLKYDLDSLPNIRDKLAYISEILFPPQSYMLVKYKTKSHFLLPLLYLHRFIMGCKKQIGRKKK